MKWTNKGHELDELGKQYLKIKKIYIWGAGKQGNRLLKNLQFFGLEKDFDILFIDSNTASWGKKYEGKTVVSPLNFSKSFNNEEDILVFSTQWLYDIIEKDSKSYLSNNYFIAFAEKLPKLDFQRNFLSVYLMYKYNKLLSPHSNYIITSRCNLNCRGCLNFNYYIKNPADQTFEDFKRHTDIVFSKFDYISSFHFSGGEVLLNKKVGKCLEYIYDTYGDRIFEIFFVSNGTIILDNELIEIMKRTKCGVLLDDYRHSVPKAIETFPKVKQLLEENNIWVNIAKAEHWYDLTITEDRTIGNDLTEDYLLDHIKECNVHYFQDFFDGKIFGCCYIGYANDMYPNKAHLYTPDPNNDYIEIADTPKMEILEYRFGYTNKGYYELCRRCKEMHGASSVYIPVAEQIKKGE